MSTRTPATQACGTVRSYKAGCRCIGCTHAIRVYNARYREANARKIADASRQRERLKRYGLTEGDIRALKRHQGYRCAICRTLFPKDGQEGKRMHVDHCHITNRVRGLLCSRCNSGIGKLGDSVDGLRRALVYLEAFEAKGAR